MTSAGSQAQTPSATSRRSGRVSWLLVAVVLLGLGLGLHQLAADSLWLDEIVTAVAAQEPTVAAMLATHMGRNDRPLPSLLAYGATRAGGGEFWLRLPSVFWGTLGLVLAFKVGQVLFGEPEGLLTAFLLALSPFYVHYSQEARAYALVALLSLLSLYFLLMAWRRGQWRWWLGFALASSLNTYTHYTSAFVLAAEVAAAGLLWLWDLVRWWRAGPAGRSALGGLQRRRFVGLAASLVLISLAFLPSLAHLQTYAGSQIVGGTQVEGYGLSAQFLKDLANIWTTGLEDPSRTATSTWVLLALFGVGVGVLLWQRQGRALTWIGAWMATPFLVLSLLPSPHFFAARYVIFLLPLFLLLVVRGSIGLADGLMHLVRRTPLGGPLSRGVLLAGSALALGAVVGAPLPAYYAWQKTDWRGAAAYLRHHARPGDVIITEGLGGPGRDSHRPYRCLQYYLGPAFGDYLVVQERDVAFTLAADGQLDRDVWGVLFGFLGQREPTNENVVLQRFTWVTVLHRQDAQETTLDRAISVVGALGDLVQKPGRFNVEASLGQLYVQKGDVERALEHLARAEETMAGNARAVATLVGAYAEVGRLAAERGAVAWAGKAYQQTLALYQRSPESLGGAVLALVYRDAGLFFSKAGQIDASAEAFRVAIEMWSQDGWLHILRADALVAQGNLVGAAVHYREALLLQPEYATEAWYHVRLGDLHRLAGEVEQAITAYQQALLLEPGHEQAAKWLKALQP